MFGACNAIIACAGTSTELLIVDRLGRRGSESIDQLSWVLCF